MLGHQRHVIYMAFRWRVDDGRLIVVFDSFPPIINYIVCDSKVLVSKTKASYRQLVVTVLGLRCAYVIILGILLQSKLCILSSLINEQKRFRQPDLCNSEIFYINPPTNMKKAMVVLVKWRWFSALYKSVLFVKMCMQSEGLAF